MRCDVVASEAEAVTTDTLTIFLTLGFFALLLVGIVVTRVTHALCFKQFRIDERGHVY
ncbi:hypothetical protein PTSG_11017 [Salpingoeca rosetta]|uniref:Uncharacterized protein n=1 Tax=Salpingoeca rosetta (strain ATCC 50818 / BSB-021) TaxID=946362 RepID=F2USG3_SALR5|nr:uncharacterized protein PTSG_11017 [Salpingoeca rosetta]EGD81072.1 hypothetical protein PTSG_11017 [Salpingoeca rosetta]|eukprot:XP_004987941.1 hypothetical protein PTSG_11017 [Salpingoeca rosetta]